MARDIRDWKAGQQLLNCFRKTNVEVKTSFDDFEEIVINEHVCVYILSPMKLNEVVHEEIDDLINCSSMVFLLEIKQSGVSKWALFTGDTNADVVKDSFDAFKKMKERVKRKIDLEFCDIPHHGSKHNFFSKCNSPFCDLIEAKLYGVSTNGDRHFHPHNEVIRSLKKKHCVFNYRDHRKETQNKTRVGSTLWDFAKQEHLSSWRFPESSSNFVVVDL